MNKPSILFILLGAYPYFERKVSLPASGGAEMDCASIARALAGTHAVSFIVGEYGQDDEKRIENIRFLKLKRSKFFPFISWCIHTVRLFGLIRKAEADIIFSKGISWQTLQLMLIAFFLNKKLVIKSSHRRNIDGSQNAKWDGKLCSFFLNRIDAFILQNHEDEKVFRDTYPHFKQKLLVIRNFQEIPESIPRTDFRKQLLWAGRAETFKRPELFLELAVLLPDWSCHMVMPKSTSVLFSTIKEKAKTVPHLIFYPGLPQRELASLMGESAFLVSTSVSEGFPNVFIEALKHRTPILTFVDFDRLLEQWKAGKRLNALEELPAFLSALTREQWIKYSENAFVLAQAEFSSIQGAKRYTELFQELQK